MEAGRFDRSPPASPSHDPAARPLSARTRRLLVALSGGSDSVALTFILRELAANGGFSVAGLAHFNHRLRPTADRDEQFCRELAATVRAAARRQPTLMSRDYAATERLGIEEAARRARYAFLHRCAADIGADRIAVGHTRDDQAETFLLKLIRGAGLTGLGGIYPRRGGDRSAAARCLPRRAARLPDRARRILGGGRIERDLTNPRNRIRHRVIPGARCRLRRRNQRLNRQGSGPGPGGRDVAGLSSRTPATGSWPRSRRRRA